MNTLSAPTEAKCNTVTSLFVRQPPPKIHPPKDKASDVVQVVMAFDANLVRYVPNVVRSIKTHSAAAVAYHFLIDGVSAADQASLHQACPDIDCTWYDMADHFSTNKVQYKARKNITRSTMSRLFLPELLPQLDTVVYLDVDIIVLGDIAELATIELGDAPLAACSGRKSQWHAILQQNRTLSARKKFEFERASGPAANLIRFNAGVLVLSLDTLRRDNFTAQALPISVNYTIALNDQDLLNLYAGKDYVRLPAKWNLHPKQITNPETNSLISPCDWNGESVGIVHWWGKRKPWQPQVIGHDVWQRFS